ETRQKSFLQDGWGSSKGSMADSTSVQLYSVLATVNGPCDTERSAIIEDGLPNVRCGFPSDHLPIGALFAGAKEDSGPRYTQNSTDLSLGTTPAKSFSDQGSLEMKTGVSSTVQRRRTASQASFSLRRRHNSILNAVSEWAITRGLDRVACDQPLYKNELLVGHEMQRIKRKSRAPDLMGILCGGRTNPSILIIEVAVASDPGHVREKKLAKYSDLVDILSDSSSYAQCELFALVFHENGTIPPATKHDIELLDQIFSNHTGTSENLHLEVEHFCSHLQSILSKFL
ncbi:MAG: hypothetical protein SGILL_008780, partial [Bacillariaceae sp.]